MFKLLLAALCLSSNITIAVPGNPVADWINWEPTLPPFEFQYEFHPAWCIDEDPFCESFSGWCMSANETQLNYMKEACRRTCNLCYEGMNLTEICYDKDRDCAEREDNCYSEATAEAMYYSCPQTCGFCNDVCTDLAVNCDQLTDYCTLSSWHQAVMQSKCRLTCSFCRVYDRELLETTECYDADENCIRRIGLCDMPHMQEEMRQRCAHTCGFCDYVDSEADIPTTCVDTELNCDEKKHLCYVAGRHSIKMWRSCQRTCGYCPGNNFADQSDHGYF